ncbi:MAG: cytochrome c biogenesis protein CcsA [bacterium]|nr:cytochrome c biogenesis protein CcsA [bacterium]
MTSALWYNACILGYIVALFIYIFNLAFNKALLRRIATVIVGVAFLLETTGMVFRWIEAGEVEVAAVERTTGLVLSGLSRFMVFTQHPPWSNLYEIMVYMSWGIVLVYLVCEVKWRIRFMGIFALIITLTVLGIASLTDGTVKPLVPALKSWWIMVHVISASIAYAAGTLGAVASLLYLVKAKERLSLTALASGVMATSVVLALILGRGFNLILDTVYRVKLFKNMGGDFVVVGKAVDGKLIPYYVPSPGVGWLLLLAILFCIFAAILLFKKRKQEDVPTGLAKTIYFMAVLLTIGTGALMIINDVTGTVVIVDTETAATLIPPGPWRLALQSNSWDLGFLALILLGQLFIGLVIIFPGKIRALLPKVEQLDRMAYATIMVSFVLVAVVLVTGALWAHYAWGRYWAWDPKETGALIIWLTYALYLHTRVTYGWAGPRSAVIGVFAFFVIIAGFLGVNLGWFADGLHSYGSS